MTVFVRLKAQSSHLRDVYVNPAQVTHLTEVGAEAVKYVHIHFIQGGDKPVTISVAGPIEGVVAKLQEQ